MSHRVLDGLPDPPATFTAADVVDQLAGLSHPCPLTPMSSPARVPPWLRAALAFPLGLLLAGLRPALGQDRTFQSGDIPPGTYEGRAITARDDAFVSNGSNGTSHALLEPLPTVDAAVIFDDFRYVEPVGYTRADKSGPPNSILGRNEWLEGSDLDHLSVGARTRAWYGFGWQDEYVDFPCQPLVVCYDNNLYDDIGTELDTEPVDEAPGHAVMRFLPEKEYSTDRLFSPLLTSGFAARTGTWVARVRLPTFGGFDEGRELGVLLAPVWLKSPDEVWETRPTWASNRTRTNWWETNIEIWRQPISPDHPTGWRPYADYNPAGRVEERYLSAGNSWWTYSDAFYHVRPDSVQSSNATFGPCTVVHHSESDPDSLQTSNLDQTACLNAMTGTPTGDPFEGVGHPYVYVMMKNTGQETSRYVYVRSEDDDGRPTPSSGFESLLLDQEQSNYVDPGFFNAQLQMILYAPDTLSTTGTIGDQSIDMRFDWFLYTPDTTLTVQEAPDYARAVRQRLGEYNGGRPAREQVWRVNTTGLALEAPVRVVPNAGWASCNPWGIQPTANWDFEVEKTERNGRTYFTAHLLRGRRRDLRRMFQSVEWHVVGGRRFDHTVRDEGYTLERGAGWGPDGPFDVTATVTQTSPVVDDTSTAKPGDSAWVHNRSTECPDGFGPATRRHTYRYDPTRGEFYEVFRQAPKLPYRGAATP